MGETDLILGVAGLPPESARNCQQELSPIPNGEFKKSINGDLLFLETNERRRYKSVISCKDVNSPIIEGIWIGSQISVGCIQHLWQGINPREHRVGLIRPPVRDSVCAITGLGDSVRFHLNDCDVTLSETHEEKVFVCFRPWLTMKVMNFCLETNEWGMSGGWKLFLEEL
ncbi:MAG: hypothetical protein LBG20_00045 [Holosporaceae bacterium]|jgi:hypothetical protein|nr:hypothetical protein [Holosporaceae bacterium]